MICPHRDTSWGFPGPAGPGGEPVERVTVTRVQPGTSKGITDLFSPHFLPVGAAEGLSEKVPPERRGSAAASRRGPDARGAARVTDGDERGVARRVPGPRGPGGPGVFR